MTEKLRELEIKFFKEILERQQTERRESMEETVTKVINTKLSIVREEQRK